uniref:EF-hand domain-containing protein n=1 Tax=Sander lucioperca TaxID=283035 RepID=A0A8C9Z446_SANLU
TLFLFPFTGTKPGNTDPHQKYTIPIPFCHLFFNFGWVLIMHFTLENLGFAEFKDLWQVLNGWKMTFASYDRDRSGTVEGQELQHAVASMGYNLSPQAMNIIMKRFSSHGRITFDDFVSCCVKLRALTDQFQRRDTTRTGKAAFQYDDVSFHNF